MNSDKMSEKMGDLLRFVDLLVKQACRRAAYDYQMRSKPLKEDKTSIYSLEYLKKIHEKPRENIYRLVKNPQRTLKGLKVDNGFNMQKKDNKFTKIEQEMLLSFVNKVIDQAPPRQLQWIDLQHYIYYVYRNFACANPDPSAEVLSTFFICEMKDLVDSLKREDESQVWLRVFTLLREYCIFAQWHYSKNDEEHALLKFFCYYEAMLTAAKNLVPVFSDFERDVIYKNYRVCWVDFNTFIFIRFFYESERVKSRLAECVRTKNSPGDAPQMFTLLSDLKKLWAKEQTRISLVNQEGKLQESTPEFTKEKKIIGAHKRVLAGNFWVERTKEEKKKINLNRLDHNIFDLLRDRTFFPEGPGLNKNGQCICEECLVTKFKLFLDCQPSNDFSAIRSIERSTVCHTCKTMVKLESFHRHVTSHAMDLESQKRCVTNKSTNLTRIIAEKMNFVKLGNSTVNLSDLLNDKLKISDDFQTSRKTDSSTASVEQILKENRESPTKTEHLLNKNGRNVIKIKKELLTNGIINGNENGKDKSTNTVGSKLEKLSENWPQEIPVSIKTEKLGETELRIRDIRRNWHKPYPTSRISKCTGTDDDSSMGVCPGHVEPDNVEQKKCDCTYCEVFGAVHKNAELRDRLRLRLHQRREKKSTDNIQDSINNVTNVKVNKVESRVPLPTSPTNMPSTPSIASTDSSVGTKELSDIRGLVNYIEGNTALNKIELARKKAAKKARQKERREQERVQAEEEAKRKLEEQKHKEEERKRELLRRQEEQKLLEAQNKKKLKKQRQLLKKMESEKLKSIMEETIPAMVTIKRVNGENGSPSVTITLKGYTPDQDKLLYTLVDDPAQEEKQTKIEPPLVEASKKVKKKKTKTTNNSPQTPTEESKVIAKEVKVTLAVDKNPSTIFPDVITAADKQPKIEIQKENKREVQPTEEEIKALGNLRLPPGITITKVEGPISNRKYLGSDTTRGTSIVGKSGVIVVDTEKLIHNSDSSEQMKVSKSNKKKKKKNKKAFDACEESNLETTKPKMVTLKNPIFQQYQNNKPVENVDNSAPAAIFTSENGMVTIRSSRLQQSLNSGQPLNAVPLPMPVIPSMLTDMPTLSNHNRFAVENNNLRLDNGEREIKPALNAQEILSGLPGIEITKVDKKDRTDSDDEGSCPDAQVSIIPSAITDEMDLEFVKEDDDWLYDNVFKPRDVLEDDMDDEELELEAFKRFCQQSVPPKCKEKVAHLNVADIVLKKKSDVKFS